MTRERLSNRQIATLKRIAICCAAGGLTTLTRDEREAMQPQVRILLGSPTPRAKIPNLSKALADWRRAGPMFSAENGCCTKPVQAPPSTTQITGKITGIISHSEIAPRARRRAATTPHRRHA